MELDVVFVKIVTSPPSISAAEAAGILGIEYSALWHLVFQRDVLDCIKSDMFKQMRIVTNEKFIQRLKDTDRLIAYDKFIEGTKADELKHLPKRRINAVPKKLKSGLPRGRRPKVVEVTEEPKITRKPGRPRKNQEPEKNG